MKLLSPVSGLSLAPDQPHSLATPDGERWPVVEGIPYLRTGRDDLVGEVLARLDRGDVAGALVELLRDADAWWDESPPPRAALYDLVLSIDRLTLREAMAALGWGRVGDYFAHRWTDPTYLAGLALITAHWRAPRTGFELACGIGHYLRVLARQGVAVTGADVVFAKLWIARRFVVEPETALVCFDAACPWPLRDGAFDLVLCQDAFYFLEPKPAILARLRGLRAPDGTLLVGHVHNRDVPNHSAGSALGTAEAQALFPRAVAYDDAALTRAFAEGHPPLAVPLHALRTAEAFALAEGPPGSHPVDLDRTSETPAVRRNPLHAKSGSGWVVRWPSERYRDEYAGLATYPVQDDTAEPTPDAIRRRLFVDLPERW